jgi:hypothetical protein
VLCVLVVVFWWVITAACLDSVVVCWKVTPSDVEDGSILLSKYVSVSTIAELVQADTQGRPTGKKGKAQTTRVRAFVLMATV